MWVAAMTNIRVASAARRSYAEALVICFRGGSFSAVLDITLCVAGTCQCMFSADVGTPEKPRRFFLFNVTHAYTAQA